jgi:hypothetical protein
MIKKKITITYLIEDKFDEHEFECARKGVELNIAIWDALQTIRTRLKYAEDVSDTEQVFLEGLRTGLSYAYIEEGG